MGVLMRAHLYEVKILPKHENIQYQKRCKNKTRKLLLILDPFIETLKRL